MSEQAIEAAAKAMFDTRDDPYDMDEWDDIDSTEREPYLCQARAALEAAARVQDRPVVELIEKAEARHGSSLWCHVTTFELRKALGMDTENWPPLGP